MTAPLRHPVSAARANPHMAFRLRCWARAYFAFAGEIDFHDAVDRLQSDAIAQGLVDDVGQDAVQATMAEGFFAAAEAAI